jgi:hypothetical protein
MSIKAKTIAAIIAAAVAVFLLALVWPRSESVESYRGRLITEVNQALARDDNWIRKKIEDAHVTVTTKSARVTACTVSTVDGSGRAGRNGSNVSDVDLVITVIWDGWIQKNGYTEFEVLYDNQNKRTKDTRYLRSNAMINLDTVDWFGVGVQVGAFLATAAL